MIDATGGMVLSGDDLTTISRERMVMLRKLQPPASVAAQTVAATVPGPCRLRDFWTGEERGRHPGGRQSINLPARTAQLLVCTPS